VAETKHNTKVVYCCGCKNICVPDCSICGGLLSKCRGLFSCGGCGNDCGSGCGSC
jgi:hypothetical protein